MSNMNIRENTAWVFLPTVRVILFTLKLGDSNKAIRQNSTFPLHIVYKCIYDLLHKTNYNLSINF